MRNLQARFSSIFVLREGKSLNSCLEIKEFLRLLWSRISNVQLVRTITHPIRDPGACVSYFVPPLLEFAPRLVCFVTRRAVRRNGAPKPSWCADLTQSHHTLELQIRKSPYADARHQDFVLVVGDRVADVLVQEIIADQTDRHFAGAEPGG